MSEFEREVRYTVVKHKDLSVEQMQELSDVISENEIPTVDCVVVEEGWPEYEPVWQAIEARMAGKPAPLIMEGEKQEKAK